MRTYKTLGTGSVTNLADFRDKPDCIFGIADIAGARLVGSRASLARLLKAGKFPQPMRLPSGRLAWRGSTITAWVERLEAEAAARTVQLINEGE